MKDKDETTKALRWYLFTQMVKIIAIMGGLIAIAHVVEKLRGG